MLSIEFIETLNKEIKLTNNFLNLLFVKFKMYLEANDKVVKVIHDFNKKSFFGKYVNIDSNYISLDQVLASSYDSKKPLILQVFSNDFGYIHILDVGYILTNHRNKSFELTIKDIHDITKYRLVHDKEIIEFTFVPALFLQGTRIEICQFRIPYSDHLFKGYSDKFDFRQIVNYHYPNIQGAFSTIKKVIPYYYNWFISVIELIQIYDIKEMISFASRLMYGCPFISASKERSEIFFLEDLIHQGAHNIFYAITLPDKDSFFTKPSNTPINYFTKSDDSRHIYGVFHGLFTQTNINICFDLCLENNMYKGKLKHEICGRLSDNMRRWKKAIQLFESYDILSSKGNSFFNEFRNVYNQIYSKRESILLNYDTSNQPYIFDYTKFEQLNPFIE